MVEQLLNQVKEIAENQYGGHFTIYHFTSNVKGCYGTLEEQDKTVREQLWEMRGFSSLEVLLSAMVEDPFKFVAYSGKLPND